MLSLRPKTSELLFQCYGRALHPELFVTLQSRRIDRGAFQADLKVTAAGHVVAWQYKDFILTEAAASVDQPLPQKRRLMSQRIRGPLTEQIESPHGFRYQTNFHVETMAPDLFWNFHEELIRQGLRRGLLHQLQPSNRVVQGAISYLDVETNRKSLTVHAYHTFPGEFAVVKSQSIFEIRQGDDR